MALHKGFTKEPQQLSIRQSTSIQINETDNEFEEGIWKETKAQYREGLKYSPQTVI